MTEAQIHRYARHISLAVVGFRGQERLLSASVALPLDDNPAAHCALAYLAAGGVGRIELVGEDSPLGAQEVAQSILYRPSDAGRKRMAVIEERVAALNSDVALSRRHASENPSGTLEVARANDLPTGLAIGAKLASQVIAEIAGDRK